jgi:hypothetical protein
MLSPELAESSLAATALALAFELDHPGNSATSKSMCARALNETMAKIRELAPPADEQDGVDELVDARREAARGGGGSLMAIVETVEPRIWSAPDYVSSAGEEAIELAAMAGLELDDWQQFILMHALGERADGNWARRRSACAFPVRTARAASSRRASSPAST